MKVRVASRAERRDAYVRFSEAMSAMNHLAETRNGFWARTRLLLDRTPLDHVVTEINYAGYQLLMVGNAAPVILSFRYADVATEVARDLLNSKHVTEDRHKEVQEARTAYWAACRLDLLKGPRRWQIYRPTWWRNRRLKARFLAELEQATDTELSKYWG